MFNDMKRVAVNQDDILIGGLEHTDHDTRKSKVDKILREKNMELNLPKYEHGVKKLIYHGHKLRAEGIVFYSYNVSSVADMPMPTNVTELHRSLGMDKWLGSFLPPSGDCSAAP